MSRLWKCQSDCDCICHKRRRFKTPQLLSKIFGILFVGYSGLPVVSFKCDHVHCQRHSSRYVEATYLFPDWFLARAVYLVVGTPYMSDPVFGLVVHRRLKYGSENSIFRMAREGNAVGIKSLLESRKGSPNDVESTYGSTALIVRDLLCPHKDSKQDATDAGLSTQLLPSILNPSQFFLQLEQIGTLKIMMACESFDMHTATLNG